MKIHVELLKNCHVSKNQLNITANFLPIVRLRTECNSRSGQQIPSVGYGTWKLDKAVAADLVEGAIKDGYRHIDCACNYGNEKEVGDGIRED